MSDNRQLNNLLSKKVQIPVGLLALILLAAAGLIGLLAMQAAQPQVAQPPGTAPSVGPTLLPTRTSLRSEGVAEPYPGQELAAATEETAVTAAPSPAGDATSTPQPVQSGSSEPASTPPLDTRAREPYIGIWISQDELARLPTNGSAWEHLKAEADEELSEPNLRNQDQLNNVGVLAKALVYARTGEDSYREEVMENLMGAIGTEDGGRTLALGRELVAYVIAADLINLPANADEDQRFRTWLRETLTEELDGSTLQLTQEERPNNWGTHAGASRAAVAVYLQDEDELERTATVFKGYLGDRQAYSGFIYGNLSWQADPDRPVGVNPKGATKEGHSIDGALPEEMRRGDEFQWPPDETGYPWEALQGALVQAEILCRAGYPAWEWEDRALLRAAQFLYGIGWVPLGDDEWQPWLINHAYGTDYPTKIITRPGKNMGWTAWTHSEHRPRQAGGCAANGTVER